MIDLDKFLNNQCPICLLTKYIYKTILFIFSALEKGSIYLYYSI